MQIAYIRNIAVFIAVLAGEVETVARYLGWHLLYSLSLQVQHMLEKAPEHLYLLRSISPLKYVSG